MKFHCLSVLLLTILATQSLGFAVNPKKALKFLVLQKSDIVEREISVATEATLPEVEMTVTEGDDALLLVESTTEMETVTENNGADAGKEQIKEREEVLKQLWNPAAGWKELNFPVFPEAEGEFSATSNKMVKVAQNASETHLSKLQIRAIHGGAGCQIEPEAKTQYTLKCGKPKTRIVNGEVARINDIPWTVALVRNGFFGFGASKKPYCGGALVNDRFILTASHCVDGSFANGIKVWLNEENYLIDTESKGPRLEYEVEEIIMHPDYTRRTVNNDIALLKLSKPVPIDSDPTTFITPVCLPANNNHDFSGLTGTVAGWGLTAEGGPQSNVLRKVDVPIMTNEKCNSNETKYAGKISENMLCAGYDEGGKDACQGDSGGPLVIDNNDRKTLVGIVSWGSGCSQPMKPGVYTRVARYANWILENTKDASWCEF